MFEPFLAPTSKTMVYRNNFCTLIFLTFLCLPLPRTWAQEGEPTVWNAMQELMSSEIGKGVREVLEVECEMQVSGLRSFFQLDEATTRKLEIRVKKLVSENMELLTPERIAEVISLSTLRVRNGTTFLVNGRTAVVKGEDEEEPFLKLEFSIVKQSIRMQLVSDVRSGSVPIIQVKLPKLIDDAVIEKTVSRHSETAVESYRENNKERIEESIHEFMFYLVSENLSLSSKQERPVRRWLLEHVQHVEGQTIFQSARSSLLEIENPSNDLLSPTQLRGWHLLISDLTGA